MHRGNEAADEEWKIHVSLKPLTYLSSKDLLHSPELSADKQIGAYAFGSNKAGFSLRLDLVKTGVLALRNMRSKS